MSRLIRLVTLPMLTAALLLLCFPGPVAIGQDAEREPDAEFGVAASALGYRVASDGVRVAVSTVQDDSESEAFGSVTVLGRNTESGAWETQATLPSTTAGGLFGSAIAVSDALVVVGAPAESGFTGAAYVYAPDPTTGEWSQRARLAADGGEESAFFGSAVACSGNTIVVGAWGTAGEDDRSGAAYVFELDSDDGTWSQTDKLTASNAQGEDCFGHAVALDGDLVVAGAPQAESRAGAAYVFRRTDAGWVEEATFSGSNGDVGDFFGRSVAVSGEVALVGSPFCDDDARRDCGAGYVFRFDSATASWSEEAVLTATETTSGTRVGASVSLAENLVALGAPASGIGGTQQGAALIFDYDSDSNDWIENDALSPDERSGCGTSIAICGGAVIAGSAPGGESDGVVVYEKQD